MTEEEIKPEVATEEKLSNRDALERAITESREPKEPEQLREAREARENPTKKEVTQAVEADVMPPSEFSAAGKEAWTRKDIGGIQKEFRRLSDARTQEVSRAQSEAKRASEESRSYKDLASKIAPYIEARGKEGTTPEQAMMEAVALVDQLKKGKRQSLADLKKLGFDFADDVAGNANSALEQKIEALQRSHDTLLQTEKVRHFDNVVGQFQASFQELGDQKTRTGQPIFPDLFDESEAGKQFAKELGSLASDGRFIAGVTRRFPGATHAILCREAYKYLGGRVSEENGRVSKEPNQDINKKRRAAASTPGRNVPSADAKNLVGKLGNRAALAKALEEQREH